MQPQFSQSGAPPNWHGVIFVVRSAEIVVVVRAKTHSSGECGGSAYDLDQPLRHLQLRVAQAQRQQIGDRRARDRPGSSRSSDTSPTCGV